MPVLDYLRTGGGVNDTLPDMIVNFTARSSASGGAARVTLTWSNPANAFAGVVIVKKQGSAPARLTDGVRVYQGAGAAYTDDAVAFDTAYYYRAFPYNARRQYQTMLEGAVVSATPKGEVVYYGVITPLIRPRDQHMAASVGGYALFAGGTDTAANAYVNTVDAYNAQLTRITPTPLSAARRQAAGDSVGNYALFAGGDSRTEYFDTVDAYDATLTRTAAPTLSVARSHPSGASVGNYLLIAGGNNKSSSSVDTVDCYDSSLTRITVNTLSAVLISEGAGSSDHHAMFAALGTTNAPTGVDAFDTALTRTSPEGLSKGRGQPRGETAGEHVLFAGGGVYNRSSGTTTRQNTVDAYDSALTRTTAAPLSVARYQMGSASLDEYAVFVGGTVYVTSGDDSVDVVDAYDDALTRKTVASLSAKRYGCMGVTEADYALFGGGHVRTPSDGSTDIVDAYTRG